MRTILGALALLFTAQAHAEYPNSVKDLKPVVCAQGEATSFSLVKAANPPGEAALAKVGMTFAQTPEDSTGLRLDGCFNGETFDLQRVVIKHVSMTPVRALSKDVARVWKVKGLDQALFGDVSKLLIDVGIPDEWDESEVSGTRIRGVVDGQSSAVITINGKYSANGRYEATASMGLIGDLQLGDVLGSSTCQGHFSSKATATWTMDTASFTAELCTGLGGGITTSYEFQKITVTDTSPEVPSAFRGKAIELDKEALAPILRMKFLHHNGCDSFVLNVPQLDSTYAMTASVRAGCGKSIEGAPQRTWDWEKPDPDSDKMLYTIMRGTKPGPVKAQQPGHFLLN